MVISFILIIIIVLTLLIIYNLSFSHKVIRERIHLDEIEPYLDTGDILLSRSQSDFAPMDLFFGDEFFHAAMIIHRRDIPSEFILDANTSNLFLIDIYITNYLKIKGTKYDVPVKIVPLYEGLDAYEKRKGKGNICLRQWKNNNLLSNDICYKKAIGNALLKYKTMPYRAEYLSDALYNYAAFLFNLEPKTDQIHCSELCALLLEDAGLIKLKIPAQHIRPEHFKTDAEFIYNSNHKLGTLYELILH